jgi:hypothetical protein
MTKQTSWIEKWREEHKRVFNSDYYYEFENKTKLLLRDAAALELAEAVEAYFGSFIPTNEIRKALERLRVVVEENNSNG